MQVLAEAQAAYDEGISLLRSDPPEAKRRFRAAAERFGVLVEDGVVNGRLYYNLANAHLQAGALGRAIVNYRRAQELMPGDPRLESNLEYARSLCRSRIEPSGQRALSRALLGWHRRTPPGARVTAFTAAWLLFWAVLAVHRIRSWAPLPYVALVLGAVWLVTGASAATDLAGGGEPAAGVLVQDEVPVRKGNGEGFALQFEEPLHAGVEFELIERRPGWLHIRLADGKTGWIRQRAAEMV